MDDREIIEEFYRASPDREKLVGEALTRLHAGEPCAYIIGEWYFWRYTFRINRDCLIPRPDTERLVERALGLLPENAVFADLCTGSGCIALSLLGDRKDLRARAYDISESALSAARENAGLLGVKDRITFHPCDLMKEDPLGDEMFDAVISNPPYVRSDVIPLYPSLSHEPRAALDGGNDGMDFYRRFIRTFAKNVKKGGYFLFEIGYDQGEDIKKLAEDHGFSCRVIKDYGNNDRVAEIRVDTDICGRKY